MTTKEIREKETKALDHELVERQKHLFDLRSQAVTEKLEDPSQLRKTKKDIARIKTVIRQRALEQQPSKADSKVNPDAKPAPKAKAKPKQRATAKTKTKKTTAKAKAE
jgi:large subunit ribosomal protein L29